MASTEQNTNVDGQVKKNPQRITRWLQPMVLDFPNPIYNSFEVNLAAVAAACEDINHPRTQPTRKRLEDSTTFLTIHFIYVYIITLILIVCLSTHKIHQPTNLPFSPSPI